MKLDENGYKLIMDFEGLRLRSYYDVAGVATIGYGCTFYPDGRTVRITDKAISIEEAVIIFKSIANRFAVIVNHLIKVPVSQCQFNSLVSLTYNIGTSAFKNSTILKCINSRANDAKIYKEFIRWSYANGYYSNGLHKRRMLEYLHYSKKL